MTIQFDAPLDPKPAGRPRFSRGKVYVPARDRDYRAAIATIAKAAMRGASPLTGALSCVIRLYRKFKATARNFGDTDNHLKNILDALNGVAFLDDSQIVSCTVEKFKADTPHVEVIISALEG